MIGKRKSTSPVSRSPTAKKNESAENKDKKGGKSGEEDEFDKELISKNPDLEIARLFFLAKENRKDSGIFLQLLEHITTNEMAPFWEYAATQLEVPIDKTKFQTLKSKNEKRLEEIDKEIKDAETNLGESEVRQAYLAKAEYLCKIGDKDNAVVAFQQTFEKTVGIGYRIDLVFNLIRIGIFFMDHKIITENIAKAKELMEKGGDWDRKNRLRSYEGLYKMAIRDMIGATELFLEAVPTFGAYELMTYEDLIFYTVISSVLALDRPDLKEKVIHCSEIQQQLNAELTEKNWHLPLAKQLLDTFYKSEYAQFYLALAEMEKCIQKDRYLKPHCQFYTRAMRVRAYQQFLTPYKSVSLDVMARSFGVSAEFLDKELFMFISSGKLNCRIDAVKRVVEMSQTDSKNQLYRKLLHDGDILLNRTQKLSRVING